MPAKATPKKKAARKRAPRSKAVKRRRRAPGVSRETVALPDGVIAVIASPDLAGLLKPLGELVQDPTNARTHDKANLDAIRASLAKYGQHRPAVVQRQGMVIKIGNGMHQVAVELGWTHIAAVVVDEDDVAATGRALADNRSGELGGWDAQAVLDQAAAIERAQGDLEGLAWTPAELAELQAKQDRAAGKHEAAADPTRLLDGFGDEERAVVETLAGYRTSIARSGDSAPMNAYQRSRLLKGDVLDYGAGLLHGLARFDPAYDPDYGLLTRAWDVVTCNYVLNVLPLEHQRVEALLTMRGLLKPRGYLLVACWKKADKDTKSPKGYQCAWGLDEWEALFGRWFQAERLGARGFMGWKLVPRALG
ncbi:MAG: hypothetical protein DRH08_00080 [Deltaproteobacteria bacterium]|nr:MAG: hypothetical protein DRH08_00080 [Deltaproteobacteria bacterium]